MDTVQDIFGKKIKSIRRARDITQEKLADLSGLSLQYIGEIERGRRNPSLTSIEQLSKALDIPMAELFSLEEFRLSMEELRTILARQIESADEDRLRIFFSMAQVIFR
ncbi:transcriptional regulator, XRE family [Desulfovibrio sp. DV]|uniref:helix-turn-helix domain-containing protein n=1 Tax=Desulfovibrio sp. DV TaxID=1844708 RepID=UPI00094B8BA9|nr:helix-turn-helix transcriptional regulator [Desulfovibrio sp. DV]OLN25496.1 transcriptional regulator, XRE family [Desulfovibrio sp. DV]